MKQKAITGRMMLLKTLVDFNNCKIWDLKSMISTCVCTALVLWYLLYVDIYEMKNITFFMLFLGRYNVACIFCVWLCVNTFCILPGPHMTRRRVHGCCTPVWGLGVACSPIWSQGNHGRSGPCHRTGSTSCWGQSHAYPFPGSEVGPASLGSAFQPARYHRSA